MFSRAAMLLLTLIFAFAGAQTAWAQFDFSGNVIVNIEGSGTVTLTHSGGTVNPVESGTSYSVSGQQYTLNFLPSSGYIVKQVTLNDIFGTRDITNDLNDATGIYIGVVNGKSYSTSLLPGVTLEYTYTVTFEQVNSSGDDPVIGGDDPSNPGGDDPVIYDPSNPGGDDPLPANTYRVRFDGNQANYGIRVFGSMDDQMFTVGVAQALAANAFTNNVQGLYPYCGWNTKADGTGTAYADGQVVTDIAAEGQTITLYAQWGNNAPTQHDYGISYFVHFDANGGEGTMADQVYGKLESKNLSPCTFTRTHYNFTGWNTKADGSGTAYTDQQNINPGGDITLYAQWEKEADLAVNGNTYTINTAAGWNEFCDCLQDNDTYNRFSGKTVKLGNDIGTAQDPITRMAGSSKHDFCGTFDGQGYTLTVNISSDSRDYTAPFSYVSNVNNSPATIRNLNVAGTVTATKDYAGGLVGAFWGTLTIENCTSSVAISTNNKHAAGFISCARGSATIRNCLSSVAITGTISGDGTHAGFIGGSSNGVTTTIEGCAFTGSMLGSTTTHCAGFVGYNSGTLTITNSIYAPADDETWVSSDGSATFARGNAPTTTNTYYTRALGTEQGKQAHTVTAGEHVTISAIALSGSTKTYDFTNITTYANGGLTYGGTKYYGSGDVVSLTLSNSSGDAPAGYQYGYSASAGTLSDTEPYTLTMPDADVTITVGLSVIDWATESDGDADHPYMIYNKDQLDLLAERVNNGTYYSGKYFKLGNDINYPHNSDWNAFTSDENNFEAIGGNKNGTTRTFLGHFDGNNKTISGIRIYKNGSSIADSYQGIFGRTGNGADIHDLTLADARITGYLDIGGIVGYNSNTSTVNRCHVAANVAICAVQPNVSSHGGIVGVNDRGTIENCISAATLTVADADNSNYYGGIAGTNRQYSTLHDNLVIGATVPAVKSNCYGAITGYNRNSTLEHNYYAACKVANVWNTTGVGCGSFGSSPNYFIADATEDDGAVPALRDQADNTYALSLFAAIPATLDLGWGAGKYPVQLAGRTLTKDGNWNTLCLPFSLTAAQIAASPLAGATIKTMDDTAGGTRLDNGKLTLKFNTATSIEAGKPYIVKWEGTSGSVSNPVFTGVTISSTTPTAVVSNDKKVTFVGQYSPFSINSSNINEIILMTTGNKIGYSKNPRTLNCFRCHFYVPTSGGQQAHSIEVDFGEGETTSLSEELRVKSEEVWYSLDGRKLEGKPTAKGMYIVNGRKVIIK